MYESHIGGFHRPVQKLVDSLIRFSLPPQGEIGCMRIPTSVRFLSGPCRAPTLSIHGHHQKVMAFWFGGDKGFECTQTSLRGAEQRLRAIRESPLHGENGIWRMPSLILLPGRPHKVRRTPFAWGPDESRVHGAYDSRFPPTLHNGDG